MFISRYVSPLLMAGIALFGPIAQGSPPSEAVSGGSDPHPFDGYTWLDIDGEPLPFQTDAEIEEFLRTAEVTDKTLVNVGITMPRRLTLTRDGVSAHAIFKDVEVQRNKVTERTCGHSRFYLDWRDSHTFDVAAYRVDRMLEINRVPPAVSRHFGGSRGTMVIWVEQSMNETERKQQGLEPPDQLRWRRQHQIMQVFNNLIAKRDVNPGNTLVGADWRLWFIDSTRAFGPVRDLVCIDAITGCERGLWKRLQELEPDHVRQVLKPVLSKSDISALLVRRDKLVEHISGLIEEQGEEWVIFDMMPGNEMSEAE